MAAALDAIEARIREVLEAIALEGGYRSSLVPYVGDEELGRAEFSPPEDGDRVYQLSYGGLTPRRPTLQGKALVHDVLAIAVLYVEPASRNADSYGDAQRRSASDANYIIRGLVFALPAIQGADGVRSLEPKSISRLAKIGASRYLKSVEFDLEYQL